MLAVGNACLEQAAQAGQAGAVAQQDHRHGFVRQMETAVAPHAQADAAAHWRVFGEPAGADAEAAVVVLFLAHDQFQHAVSGNRGDRVFAHRQRHHCVDQRLRMQTDQMRAVLGQLP